MMLSPLHLAILAHLVAFPGEDDVEAIAAAVRPLPKLETPPRTFAEWNARAAFVAAHWRDARTAVTSALRELTRRGLVERCRAPELCPGIAARIDLAAADFREHWRGYTRCLGWTKRPTARQAWLLGAERVVRDAILFDDASEEATGTEDFPTYAVLLHRVSRGPLSVRAVLGSSPDGHTKRVWSALVEAGLVRSPSQRWPTATGIALVEGGREVAA